MFPRLRGCGRACQERGTRHSPGGFTLAEVLAAVLLLAIGLLAVIAAAQGARDSQQRAVYISAARSIAQSKIDELRAASFDTLVRPIAATADSSLPRGNCVTVSVSRYPNDLETNLCLVTVNVTWPEGKSSRSVSYATLISRK